MTLMPVQPVRRLYDDHTLSVIEDLIGGGPFDQASDAIASQYLDPEVWRSMHKGPLVMSETIEREKSWAFARAIAYDPYLPTVVLARVQSMQQASQAIGAYEVVYFPDAIGILHRGVSRNFGGDDLCAVEARMCLLVRDIHRTQDFIQRHDPFERTMWRWLDYLHAASVPCDGLKLPRIEHLARSARATPLEFTPSGH